MKKILLLFCVTSLLVACDNNKKGTRYLKESVGNINVLQIVIDNELWNGPVGEEIRNQFAAPTDGLPQDEPLFTMRQMVPETFTGFARNSRLFLKVQEGNVEQVSIDKEVYAKPQLGVTVTALTEEGLVALLKERSAEIIKKMKAIELQERQKRARISKMRLDSLTRDFNVTLNAPSAYRIAKASPDFYWLRKDLKSGTTNIIIYEVPLQTIGEDSTLQNVITMRNTIGARLMPVEEEGVFRTEDAYPPYLFTTEIDGKFTYETKGIWEVKDQFMAGPFINYAIKDKANNRWLIIEGFVYAPSVEKRDLQFELEAIIRTATLKE